MFIVCLINKYFIFIFPNEPTDYQSIITTQFICTIFGYKYLNRIIFCFSMTFSYVQNWKHCFRSNFKIATLIVIGTFVITFLSVTMSVHLLSAYLKISIGKTSNLVFYMFIMCRLVETFCKVTEKVFVMGTQKFQIHKFRFISCTQKNVLLNLQKFGWPNKVFCLNMGQ